MRRALLTLGATVLGVAMLSAPAGAQYVSPLELDVSPFRLVCPGPVSVTGTGFDPGTDVLIEFDQEIVATLGADADGDFAGTATLGEAEPGTHLVSALGTLNGDEAFVTEVVECLGARGEGIGPAEVPPPAEIAVTGADVTMLAVLAMVLLTLGIFWTRPARRGAHAPR